MQYDESDVIQTQEFPLWDKLKEKRKPLSFSIEITARCNNNCRHCYINLPANDPHAQAEELTTAEILDYADQAVALGAVWCLVTGGEPLLRPDFTDIYLGLKRKGLLIEVFTNATTIQDAHIRLFQRYPPRDIEVTVYGVTQDTYETVTRRPGSFRAFQRGLQRLFENGIPVRLKAMALKSNLHELPQIAEYCRAHTKDFFRFDPQLHLRFDGDSQRNSEIRQERLSPEEIVALERSDSERFLALQKKCNDLIVPEFRQTNCDHLFHCGAGLSEFTISHNGMFRLCSSLWAPGTIYNLRQGTLRQAWEEFVPRVRDLRVHDPRPLKTCRICPILNLCFACPAHNYLETGAMDGESAYFCAVAHARAQILQQPAQEGQGTPPGGQD